jgi:hypothetical protein
MKAFVTIAFCFCIAVVLGLVSGMTSLGLAHLLVFPHCHAAEMKRVCPCAQGGQCDCCPKCGPCSCGKDCSCKECPAKK